MRWSFLKVTLAKKLCSIELNKLVWLRSNFRGEKPPYVTDNLAAVVGRQPWVARGSKRHGPQKLGRGGQPTLIFHRWYNTFYCVRYQIHVLRCSPLGITVAPPVPQFSP